MQVEYERRSDGLGRVHLLPDARGEVAIDGPGLAELAGVLASARADRGLRALVLSSAGPEFCRGMALASALELDGARIDAETGAYAACLRALDELALPVIALVDGDCVGGGLGLACVADELIATPRAGFRLPETHLGLIPAMVLPVLMRRLGEQKARWLAMSARRLDAREALRCGLVDQLADGPEALERLARRSWKEVRRGSPAALGRLKRYTREIAGQELDVALPHGARQTASALREPATRAALRAWLAGELPRWPARATS